jgi:hypothetical protein
MTESEEHTAIDRLRSEVDARLAKIDPAPFSPSAFDVYKGKVARYMSELFDESIKMSRRQAADVVSAAQVERASEYLITSAKGRIARHIGTVGGIVLGAALSYILAMVRAAQFTPLEVGLSTALAVIGGAAVAVHIARD